jgi:hypothetical protein
MMTAPGAAVEAMGGQQAHYIEFEHAACALRHHAVLWVHLPYRDHLTHSLLSVTLELSSHRKPGPDLLCFL